MKGPMILAATAAAVAVFAVGCTVEEQGSVGGVEDEPVDVLDDLEDDPSGDWPAQIERAFLDGCQEEGGTLECDCALDELQSLYPNAFDLPVEGTAEWNRTLAKVVTACI